MPCKTCASIPWQTKKTFLLLLLTGVGYNTRSHREAWSGHLVGFRFAKHSSNKRAPDQSAAGQATSRTTLFQGSRKVLSSNSHAENIRGRTDFGSRIQSYALFRFQTGPRCRLSQIEQLPSREFDLLAWLFAMLKSGLIRALVVHSPAVPAHTCGSERRAGLPKVSSKTKIHAVGFQRPDHAHPGRKHTIGVEVALSLRAAALPITTPCKPT